MRDKRLCSETRISARDTAQSITTPGDPLAAQVVRFHSRVRALRLAGASLTPNQKQRIRTLVAALERLIGDDPAN